jgi:catechol 2,3-dioxygenase-like lactoylglutathione lyase family enzyme
MTFDSSATPVAFLYVSDRDRALAFYRDLLGLQLRSSDPFGDFLEMGAALVRMTGMPDYKAGQHPVLGWDVPDIAVAARALRNKGVALTIYEGMGQDPDGIWTTPDGDTKVAWFTDPDGNVLSLSQS